MTSIAGTHQGVVVSMAKNQKKGEAEWEKGEERTYATVVQKFENAGEDRKSVV